MARPIVNPLAEILYSEALEPAHTVHDEDLDWPLLRWAHAWTLPFVKMWEVAYGGDFAWETLLDPSECPDWALPWLAQWGGVRVEPSWTTEQLRDAIKDPSGFARGRPAAMIAAAARGQTGDAKVEFVERFSSAWTVLVRLRASETPDPDQKMAEILRSKPGPLILNVAFTDNNTYYFVWRDFATYQDVFDEYATYEDLYNDF
jgi:hypothetical protein